MPRSAAKLIGDGEVSARSWILPASTLRRSSRSSISVKAGQRLQV
jgi:hypothetical protein